MFMYTDYTQHLLDNVKKIHFIGCGGSGMYPLIQTLSAKGYDISGSDVLDGSIIRSEREMGVRVTLGHSADNVFSGGLCVYCDPAQFAAGNRRSEDARLFKFYRAGGKSGVHAGFCA